MPGDVQINLEIPHHGATKPDGPTRRFLAEHGSLSPDGVLVQVTGANMAATPP